jgi:hypothetical protein
MVSEENRKAKSKTELLAGAAVPPDVKEAPASESAIGPQEWPAPPAGRAKRAKVQKPVHTTTAPPPIRGPPLAYDIGTFCRLHSISPAFYFKLRRAGLAPAEMRLGGRVLISQEAAAAWRRRMSGRASPPLAEAAPPAPAAEG